MLTATELTNLSRDFGKLKPGETLIVGTVYGQIHVMKESNALPAFLDAVEELYAHKKHAAGVE